MDWFMGSEFDLQFVAAEERQRPGRIVAGQGRGAMGGKAPAP